jgi:hypothetical protein
MIGVGNQTRSRDVSDPPGRPQGGPPGQKGGSLTPRLRSEPQSRAAQSAARRDTVHIRLKLEVVRGVMRGSCRKFLTFHAIAERSRIGATLRTTTNAPCVFVPCIVPPHLNVSTTERGTRPGGSSPPSSLISATGRDWQSRPYDEVDHRKTGRRLRTDGLILLDAQRQSLTCCR